MRRPWLAATAVTVVAAAGLLVLPVLFPRGRGHSAADRTHYLLWLLADVLEQYRAERGRYPQTDEGLEVLVREGFLRKLPLDAWGNPFQYRFPSSRSRDRFDLWSYGSDGQSGGERDAADIRWGDDA